MKINVLALIISGVIFFTACCHNKTSDTSETAIPVSQVSDSLCYDSAFREFVKNEHMVLATLYQQTAAEYRALCYQAFNIGKIMLDIDLADKSVDKHRIIVLDVDETVLDNSPFQAKSVLESTSYPVNWDEWCNLAKAEPLAGAIDFLNYARANGVSIFYVTNRKDYLKDVTIKNLANLGFPHADATHVITRSAEASKEGRRQELLKKYHISLLFGDNLNDFAEDFEGTDVKSRFDAVDMVSREFGRKFIVLPNAMYGDWENTLYGYSSRVSDSLKFELRRKALKSFN
ncbi:MAG: 5'-nucleotidase, lipoprotein e(P4) family [Lentimicrobium sp.]|nr:5'-nucleotidase, lipoprotein e(P4) family [Lentimicrobium sp.]